MLTALSLSIFGTFHTALALVAVVAGLVALFRHGEISSGTRPGLNYILFTLAASVTGLFIFRHGGFGAPHVLAILTLLVLAIAWSAEKRATGTGYARYVAVPGYTLTLFFHLIPGLTETGTRIPVGNPAFSGPEDPTLKALVGLGFLVYLAGAFVQVARIRRSRRLVASA